MKYRCIACGYIYDEDAEGTKFEELPEDWTCPLCGVGKDMFEKATQNTVWVCRNCGFRHVGPMAPEMCPVCAHPKAYFEIKAENY